MTGRIFQRGKYLWVAYYRHGKEQRECARHVRTDEKIEASDPKAQHEAERYLKQRLGELEGEKHGGHAFIGAKQKRVTINDLLDSLASDYKTRGKDTPQFASHLKRIRTHFGTWKAIEVAAESIEAYIAEMREQEYADGTINRSTELLKQAYGLAVRRKKLAAAPEIQRLSEIGNEREGIFETADFEAVVQNLPDYVKDFARFGFITGWRKGAISKLRWTSVSDDVILLVAKNSKSRKPVSVPIEGELASIIERRRAGQVWEDKDGNAHFAEYVFHLKGKPVGDFRRAWKTACIKAGVSNRMFHDLRRTAATNMRDAGVPQSVAMSITGHRTDSMWRRYNITDEAQKREALAKTQDFVSTTAKKRKVVSMEMK